MSEMTHANHEMFPDAPANLMESLSDQAQHHFLEWAYVLKVDAGNILRLSANEASQFIFTAATNDVLALVYHLDAFDGRSAAYAARTLFEHAVSLHDVLDDEDAAERYLRHQSVTVEAIVANDWWLDLLNSQDRERESRRLKRLGRKSRRQYEKAVEDYGTSFNRGWASLNLKRRAKRVGLEPLYRGYQILSSVVHGSSGSMLGLVRPVRGTPLHRVGLDLEILPTAFAEGLMSFKHLAERLAKAVPGSEAQDIAERTTQVLHHLDEVYAAVESESNRLWPTDPVEAVHSIAAVYPSGAIRWYLYNEFERSVVRADLVSEFPSLDNLVAAIKDAARLTRRPEPALISCQGARVSAKPDARRASAESLQGNDELARAATYIAQLKGVEIFRIDDE